MTEPATRTYRSTRRQEQAARTRADVLAAATELFSERGWSGTSVRDVARKAGVAVETVYSAVGSKADLLLAAIDVGVVGDVAPVPLSERPEFARLGTGSRDERVATAVRLISGINQRSWGLRRAIAEAATSEPRMADLQRGLELRRRANIGTAAELVLDRPVGDDELDALWVVMNAETFTLLTGTGGRSVEDYERWLAVTIDRVFGPGA